MGGDPAMVELRTKYTRQLAEQKRKMTMEFLTRIQEMEAKHALEIQCIQAGLA